MYNRFCELLGNLTHFRGSEHLNSVFVILCVINAVSSVLSVVSNGLVIVAIRQTSALHHPSYVLLCTLAISDLGVGLLVQPLYIATRVVQLELTSRNVYCPLGLVYSLAADLFSGLSLFTITAISVDRFLAVYLHLRYRVVVTRKRTIALAALLSVTAAVWAFLGVFNDNAFYVTSLIFIPSCLVITSLNFLNINRLLRQLQNRINTGSFSRSIPQQDRHDHEQQHDTRANVRLYHHVLNTMMLVYGVFLLCYIPYILCVVVLMFVGVTRAVFMAGHITITLVFMNSSFNPVLYYSRIPEIRQAFRHMLHLDG